MRIALVYDRVNKWGGAERVLLAIHRVYPEADLFTAVYRKEHARWADVFRVKPSFLQGIPFLRSRHEYIPFLTPMAFETFSFSGYDVVLSVTSAEAKNIITKPETLHICYCLTPTRYLWNAVEEYDHRPGFGMFDPVIKRAYRKIVPVLRRWDTVAAMRPDAYIAISELVGRRILMYYHRTPEAVIYPPVDVTTFSVSARRPPVPVASEGLPPEYFLCVARGVGYKRLDLAVRVFSQLRKPLVIVGRGREYGNLARLAGPTVRFVTRYLTDEELALYYQNCRAFVHAGSEDFGIAAAEAQACGKPVIAYRDSGISEIVRDRETGLLFDDQSEFGLRSAIEAFEAMVFSASVCRRNAVRFSTERFMKEISSSVAAMQSSYRRKGMTAL